LNKSLIVFVMLLSCSCRSTFTEKVVYSTTIISNDGDKRLYDYYIKKYGDTLVIDYQPNGDMKRTHLNGSLNYQLYKAEDGAVYFNYHNSNVDTFPCVEFSLERIYIKQTEDEEIIGETCKCFEILALAKSDGDSVLLEACYPKNKQDFFLNHKLYTSYQDYYVHELFKKNKTPYFKYYIHYPEISIQYHGVKLNKKND